VILRVAGREVARGELVSLEGELGVRIREVVR
jgi:flagellar motor switch/type III secretory pathway protein FliN